MHVEVTPACRAALEANLRKAGAQGDAFAQSTDAEAVWGVLVCESPGEDFKEWWDGQVKGKSGPDFIVDVRNWKPYRDMHLKSSRLTLERVQLDKRPGSSALAEYAMLVQEHFIATERPLAATRAQQIFGWAASRFRHQPDDERAYLWHYFFKEYLGRGMPQKFGQLSFAALTSVDKGRGSMIPTAVPKAEQAEAPMIGGPPALHAPALPALPAPSQPALPAPADAGVATVLGTIVDRLSAMQTQIDSLGQVAQSLKISGGGGGGSKCGICGNRDHETQVCPRAAAARKALAAADAAAAKARKEAEGGGQ